MKNPANTSDMAPFANPNEYPNNATVESVGEHCPGSRKRDRPLPVFRDKRGLGRTPPKQGRSMSSLLTARQDTAGEGGEHDGRERAILADVQRFDCVAHRGVSVALPPCEVGAHGEALRGWSVLFV